MTNWLAEMSSAGIEVNWLTLLIGLNGPGKGLPVLGLADIDDFATGEIAAGRHEGDAVAVVVASGSGLDETRALLWELSRSANADPEREIRKWQVILLRHQVRELPTDPIHGLLALTEFWERFDYPAECPHVVQGRGNNITPSEYFTEENYERLVKHHMDWIEAQLELIRG